MLPQTPPMLSSKVQVRVRVIILKYDNSKFKNFHFLLFSATFVILYNFYKKAAETFSIQICPLLLELISQAGVGNQSATPYVCLTAKIAIFLR